MFEDLKGQTISVIRVIKNHDNYGDVIFFYTTEEKLYKMNHVQDCCESVYIEDICGDIENIVDHPILTAEEIIENEESDEYSDSFTFTFYKISTIKESVTIRWNGSSNGYYSESVDFEEVVGKAKEKDLKEIEDALIIKIARLH
jgi:hypothetical protein